jgi:hypothetical protein
LGATLERARQPAAERRELSQERLTPSRQRASAALWTSAKIGKKIGKIERLASK